MESENNRPVVLFIKAFGYGWGVVEVFFFFLNMVKWNIKLREGLTLKSRYCEIRYKACLWKSNIKSIS